MLIGCGSFVSQVLAALAAAEDAIKANGVYKGMMGDSTWVTSQAEYLVLPDTVMLHCWHNPCSAICPVPPTTP